MAFPTGNIPTVNLETGEPADAQADLLNLIQQFNALIDIRCDADGYPPLDSGIKIPLSYLHVIPIELGGTGVGSLAALLELLGIATAGEYSHAMTFRFAGILEAATAGNASRMQRKVYCAAALTIGEGQVNGGTEGMDPDATGDTVIYISDTDYAQAGTPSYIALTLAHGAAHARATGSLSIEAGGYLYVFVQQATGGHQGAEVQINAIY